MREEIELVVAGNEASDLLPVHDATLLAAHGASQGFWTVLDEGPVEDCLALLLQRPDGSWTAHHQSCDAGAEIGRTEDGEALAHHDGHVYVIGSHFGSKRGPLRPRRAFVARFPEAAAASGPAPLEIVRNKFRLHRIINEALAGVPLTQPGELVSERFIAATRARGAARGKAWTSRLAVGDVPVNVEGAAFTPAGTLLLGLRFPVAADGSPLLVELADVPAMFGPARSWPTVVGVHVLTGATGPGELTGVRALSARPDGAYDAVVGSIDALGKESAVLDDHPAGGEITSRHVRFRLPGSLVSPPPARSGCGAAVPERRWPLVLPVERIADLAPLHHVEGLAETNGVRHYVTDEDHRITLFHT
ncbi:hypothetical protein [Pilimelia columellifera]|uniref:Uncharacterized protein n=1 Tax=Pilimelia columellifera subsp. columellifera TaxID=706583 RepID=A0ABP6AIW8_9ACTN